MTAPSDFCWKCEHPRVFHYEPDGCLYEIPRRYFDPRTAQQCSCTRFVAPEPTGEPACTCGHPKSHHVCTFTSYRCLCGCRAFTPVTGEEGES